MLNNFIPAYTTCQDCQNCQKLASIYVDITSGLEKGNILKAFGWLKSELNRVYGFELGYHYRLKVASYQFRRDVLNRKIVALSLFYENQGKQYKPGVVVGTYKEFFDDLFQSMKAVCLLLKDFKVQDLYKVLEGASLEIFEYPERVVLLRLNTKILSEERGKGENLKKEG